MKKPSGFTLVELLITIAIIGLLASFVTVSLGGARSKARDTKRRSDLSQIGRLLYATSCLLPSTGAGDYDLVDLFTDLVAQDAKYAKYANALPKDPRLGNDSESYYRYVVTAGGTSCAIYANLEDQDTEVTLPVLTSPTAGGGTGVLQASSPGWNGSRLYYQIGK